MGDDPCTGAIVELANKCNELWKEKLGDFMEELRKIFLSRMGKKANKGSLASEKERSLASSWCNVTQEEGRGE